VLKLQSSFLYFTSVLVYVSRVGGQLELFVLYPEWILPCIRLWMALDGCKFGNGKCSVVKTCGLQRGGLMFWFPQINVIVKVGYWLP
jgi:hypothetical protein